MWGRWWPILSVDLWSLMTKWIEIFRRRRKETAARPAGAAGLYINCDFTKNIKINIFVLQLSRIIIIFVCGVGDDPTCPLTYGPWWLNELKYSEDGERRPRLGRLEQPDCTTPSAESIPCERKIQPKRQTQKWDRKLGQVKIITNKKHKMYSNLGSNLVDPICACNYFGTYT